MRNFSWFELYLFVLNVFISQQKEEGKVQGQLNHTDSSQYIRDLKDQIAELKHEASHQNIFKVFKLLSSLTLQREAAE